MYLRISHPNSQMNHFSDGYCLFCRCSEFWRRRLLNSLSLLRSWVPLIDQVRTSPRDKIRGFRENATSPGCASKFTSVLSSIGPSFAVATYVFALWSVQDFQESFWLSLVLSLIFLESATTSEDGVSNYIGATLTLPGRSPFWLKWFTPVPLPSVSLCGRWIRFQLNWFLWTSIFKCARFLRCRCRRHP